MTYRTASNITSTSALLLFLQNIESDMVNVGWVNVASNLAGNFTANAGNTTTNTQLRIDVFKSPGANNSIANDWFVYLMTDQTSNTILYVSLSAGFNSTTNLVNGGYYVTNSTAATANIYAPNNFNTNANTTNLFFTNWNTGTSIVSNGSNARIWCVNTNTINIATVATPNANGYAYFYSVTIDRLIMCVANSGNIAQQNVNGSCFYVGTYDSFMPLSVDFYPLILANVSAAITSPTFGSQAMGAAISEPSFAVNDNAPVATTGNFVIFINSAWNNIFGLDPYQGDNYALTRLLVRGGGGLGFGSSSGSRGFLKDCFGCSLQSGRGDIVYWTLNGSQYTATNFGTGSAIYVGTLVTSWGPFVLQV